MIAKAQCNKSVQSIPGYDFLKNASERENFKIAFLNQVKLVKIRCVDA